MVFGSVKPSKNLHGIYDLTLFLGLLAFLFLSLFEIEQTSLNDKLFATNSLIDTSVVKLDHIVLELDVMLGIIIEVFQIGKKSISITIVLLVEVPSLWHVADYLM